MAKQIVSGNLNQYGNAGQFETDRSTWGFSNPASTNIVRSGAQQSLGLYSARAEVTSLSGNVIIYARYPSVLGKKYIFKAKVRVPSGAPIAGPTEDITFVPTPLATYTAGAPFDIVSKTVTEATDTWVDIEASVEHTNALFPSLNELIHIRVSNILLGGQLYVDQLEIYEYIDVEDPEVCDLDIDEDATTVINESSNGAGDGSIEVEEDGTGTYEYSKDDGDNYQPSNLFAGLTTGIFIIKVRDTGLAGCEDRYPFAVNFAAVTHDFTAVLTHESVSGANDAGIVLVPTGSGGPFNYTIDAGENWQTGNNFPNLPPGTYFVAVRNAAGNSVVKVVLLNAATIEFNRIFHSGTHIPYEQSGVSDWATRVNYRLYNEVRVEDIPDSGVYNVKLQAELPPSANGTAIFYLRPAFRFALTAQPPSANQSQITRLTDRIKRWKAFSGDLEGIETEPGALQSSLVNMVILGGLDKVHYPDVDFFGSYLPNSKMFLTWAPTSKLVDRNQEDFLCFYAYGNFSVLKLQIKAYYDDSTSQTSITRILEGTGFSQLFLIPAGPINSGANLIDPTKTLTKYELALLDQNDDVVSETRTYIITRVKHPLTRYVLFLNSLGAYEVIRCTGQSREVSNAKTTIMKKFLPHDYASMDGEYEVVSSVLTTETEYSTGYLTGSFAEAWKEYLTDLLRSARVYDITDGQRLPVIIMNGQNRRTDQDYGRYVRFTARRAYEDENFTPSGV